ncbi:hypothetical protein [Legionella pneumophila]
MSKIPAYVYDKSGNTSLQQGDIIRVSGKLRALFKKFYPGLPLKRYEKRYLMIISQSCDLMNDNEKNRVPKVDHINLCVISKFSSYVNRIRNKYNTRILNDYCILEETIIQEIKNTIAKLINNSESKIHFFLPQKPPFKEDMIAVLSLSYSFRVEHYNEIMENKVLSLRPEFQSKIGSLIGSFYNRVATSDLSSINYNDNMLSDFIDYTLRKNKIIPIKNSTQFEYIQSKKSEIISPEAIDSLITNFNAIQDYSKLKKIKIPLQQKLNKELYQKLHETGVLNQDMDISDIRRNLSTILNQTLNELLPDDKSK